MRTMILNEGKFPFEYSALTRTKHRVSQIVTAPRLSGAGTARADLVGSYEGDLYRKVSILNLKPDGKFVQDISQKFLGQKML